MADEPLKQKTAKGLLWGGIGNGAMQLLNLVFGIFLARLLSPSDYGVVGALTIFSATAGLLSESGFILAIVNKRTVTDDDYNTVFWFNIAASLTLYMLLFMLAPLIADFYHKPEIVSLARFLFLGFVFGGMAVVPSAYLFRNLMVKQRNQISILAIMISGTAGVVCAYYGWGYWGIAMQTVLYSGTSCLLLWIVCPWHPGFRFKFSSLASMLPFSMKQLATSLFTHFNNNFFSVILGRFFGMQQTGFYTQGSKWTTMGCNTLVGMINGVGQPVMRQVADDHERIQRVFRKLLRFTAFISFPALLGLGIISKELIEITVSAKWLPCVPIMQILCVWGAFSPISILYGNLFNSIGQPNIYMTNTIMLGVVQMLTVLLTYHFGLIFMLIVYSAINILWLLVWQYFARKHIGLRLFDVIKDISPYLILSGSIMILTQLGIEPIRNPLLALPIKIIVAAAAYILILWRFNSVVLKESLDYIFKRKK